MQYRYGAFDRITERPIFEQFGISELRMMGAANVYKGTKPDLGTDIDPGFADTLVKKFGTGYTGWLVLDIEHLGTRLGLSDDRITESLAALNAAIDVYRDTIPGGKLGIYGSASVGHLHYSNARSEPYLSARLAHYQKWLAPLLARLDSVVINAYTLDDTVAHWVDVVRANVTQARMLTSNPIQVFLKPRYNIHNPSFDNQPVPYAQFKGELQYLKGLLAAADQAVIWDGSVRPWSPENDGAKWWQAVLDVPGTSPADEPPVSEVELLKEMIRALTRERDLLRESVAQRDEEISQCVDLKNALKLIGGAFMAPV